MSAWLSMIAAVAENGVIGAGQAIPWRIPSDFAYFKATTMGKPLIMGRRQFETVGKALPGRTNIVVTRQPGYKRAGVIVVDSIEEALGHAEVEAADEEIMVIGGGEIYAQLIGQADRLYISHVNLRPEGDVYFPAIDTDTWTVVREPEITPSEKDSATYRVKVYERRPGGAH